MLFARKRLKNAVLSTSALWLALSLTVPVSLAGSQPCHAAGNASATFKQGQDYFNARNYAQAVDCFTRCMQTWPNDSNVWAWRADAYKGMKEYAKAIADINKAASLGSTHAYDYYIRGSSYFQLGQYENSVEDMTKAISFDPKKALYYNDRGAAQFGLKRFREAIQDYTSALQADPNFVTSYLSRAQSFEKVGENERALEDYNKAVELSPSSPDYLIGRAGCKARFKQYKEAIVDYDKAIAIDPKNSAAFISRGLIRGLAGETQKALDDVNAGIQLNPSNAYYYAYRAKLYIDLGRNQEAVDDATRSIQKDPNFANGYQNRAYAYMQLGNYAEALKDFDRSLSIDPQDSNCYANKASLLAKQGQHREALNCLTKALSISKMDNVHTLRADAYLKLGDYNNALDDVEAEMKLNPKHSTAPAFRTIVLSRLGRYQEAVAQVDELLKQNPKDINNLRNKASLQIFLHQESDALKTLQETATLSGTHQSHLFLNTALEALAYARLGNSAKAKAAAESSRKIFNALPQSEKQAYLPFAGRTSIAFTLAGDPQSGLEFAKQALACAQDEDADAKAIPLAARCLASAKMGKAILAETDAREALKLCPDNAFVRELCDLSSSTAIAARPVVQNTSTFPSGPGNAPTGVNRPIQDKWALVVGISKFEDPSIPQLKFASKDALDFANFLVNKCNFQRDHVRLLLNEKATQRRILEELGDRFLPRVARHDDLVVLYFSGHGSPSRADVKEKNYLIAHDSYKSSLFASGIELQDLTALLKKRVDSDRVLIVLDACHSGAADANAKDGESPANFNVDELAGAGQLVICSSQQSERSWESRRYANGVFTKKLMDGLLRSGATTKLQDAFRSTLDSVCEEVQQDQAVRQTPTLKCEWDGNDLRLAQPASNPKPLPAAVKSILPPDSFQPPAPPKKPGVPAKR